MTQFAKKTKNPEALQPRDFLLAGETGFEPATSGFGDRCSTIEPLPCIMKHVLCHANETFTSLMDGLHRVKENVIISMKKMNALHDVFVCATGGILHGIYGNWHRKYGAGDDFRVFEQRHRFSF
jgi:hypothetical protein